MYAVIRSGGKQYWVDPGDQLRVEKLRGVTGDNVAIDDVLLVADGDEIKVGQPVVAGARVTARIVEQGKNKKVIVLKKKRRKGYRLKQGHRQQYTALKIEEITS